MKFEINFKKLKDAIGLVERITGKHMTLPVLSCVYMEVADNTVIFKATNLDIGVEVSVPVKIISKGIAAVPGHILSSFISQIQEDSQVVKIEVISGNLNIQANKSKVVIKTLPTEDFPTIPKVNDGQEMDLSSDIFIKGLKSVWYSASISSVKPELSSVYIYKDADYIVFAATDSFRLAEKRIKVPLSVKINEILLPFKNISDVTRVLESMGENLKVKMSKNLISFESNGIYIVSRIIDGTFPDYKQIIPKGFATEVIALKQDLMNALKISNIFSDKFNQVHITVDPKAKIFDVQTKNSDIGENKTNIDAAITGEKMEINFNYKYIIDCFQSIDADSVSLQLSGINKPMVIRPISGDQTFMYLVMPMNR
ncbi:MAG: DNA polymerase III subunit beta [Candidatus Taylorbacteria bacterium]